MEVSADTDEQRSRMVEQTDTAALAGALFGRRVVIAEDEGITQMQLHLMLRREGMLVVGTAMTGERAVEIVLKECPDIVLMDINLAGAMNGLEASRRIMAVYDPCLVMLTAYPEHEVEARKIGASGYVIKPVTANVLIPVLIRACAERDRTQTAG